MLFRRNKAVLTIADHLFLKLTFTYHVLWKCFTWNCFICPNRVMNSNQFLSGNLEKNFIFYFLVTFTKMNLFTYFFQ